VFDVTEVREQEQNIERLLDQNIAGKPAIFFISAATGEGVEELLSHVLSKLEEMKRIEIEQAEAGAEAVLENEPIPLFKSPRRPVKPTTITNQNGTFIVESEHLERLTATADSRDYRVVLPVWRAMTRMGLAKRLEEAGIEAGDTIRIGKTDMEWF
jgi:Obg family GTPase CgtA-like protein